MYLLQRVREADLCCRSVSPEKKPKGEKKVLLEYSTVSVAVCASGGAFFFQCATN